MTNHVWRRALASVFLCLGLWMPGPRAASLEAQEPPATPTTTEPKNDGDLREQTIYVPFEKLREVFEKEGRGVFLPYDRFQALWQAAQDKLRTEAEAPPPVGAMLTEISSKATASKDVLVVEAQLSIELLRPGWHRIPLRLSDAAIRSARIGDQPARIVAGEGGGYDLLYELPKDARPQTLVVQLDYAKAIQKTPGRNTVTLQAPQAPVNRWEIHIPDSGVKVDVQPLLAASQPPDADPSANETVMLAFVGAAESVRIDWNPKAEGATGLAALLAVQAEQEVIVDEGVVRTRVRLAYQVSRAELSQLEIEVPADHKVAGVFDPNIRSWEVAAEGELQTITVQLFEPARTTQNVTIDLEKFTSEQMTAEVVMPVIRAKNVGRQQGLLVVQVSDTLRSTASQRAGLLQLDTAELPPTLSNRSWEYAFRYAALPYTLGLSIEKVEPRVRVEEFVHAYLEPDQLLVDLVAIYQIDRAGLFQLQVDIPDNYVIRGVRGQEAEGLPGVSVDSHHPDPTTPNRWLVNLSRKAEGRVGLLVQLERRLNDPNLLAPTGTPSSIPLPLPRAGSTGLEQASGRLIVFAPESLRVNPATQSGVQSISFREATEAVPYMRRGERYAEMREVLALAYTRDAVELTLSAERRKPQVHVRQFLVAAIDSGVVNYTSTFFYDISYSPVKSVRIDIPLTISGLVRNNSPGIRDEILTPAPADVPAGYVAWQFTGESEFLGTAQINLSWQQTLDALGIGQSVDLDVPHLRPQGTDRAWGQIVATKSETIDIRPSGEPTGLRPIDPQHDLMPGGDGTNAARAFEFHQDFSLILTATRYQLVEVKRTSIEAALLRIVVTRSGQVDVQALYRMKSARQRVAVKFPAQVDPQQSFDADPAKLDGQSVTLEQGENQVFYVPLVGRGPDTPFVLELRYSVPAFAGELDFPVFPDDPAVSQVFLSAYLPEEDALLSTAGPWTEEQFNPWRVRVADMVYSPSRLEHVRSDAELYEQLSADISVVGDPLNSFSVQGDRYLFSTLRPADPPDGSLRLQTMDRRMLLLGIFLVAAVVGLVFLARSLRDKLFVAGLVVVVVMALGVFWPTAAMHVLDVPFVLAAFGVAAVWGVAEVVKGFSQAAFLAKKLTKRRSETAAADAEPAVTATPESAEAKSDSAAEQASPSSGGGAAEQPPQDPPKQEGGSL